MLKFFFSNINAKIYFQQAWSLNFSATITPNFISSNFEAEICFQQLLHYIYSLATVTLNFIFSNCYGNHFYRWRRTKYFERRWKRLWRCYDFFRRQSFISYLFDFIIVLLSIIFWFHFLFLCMPLSTTWEDKTATTFLRLGNYEQYTCDIWFFLVLWYKQSIYAKSKKKGLKL